MKSKVTDILCNNLTKKTLEHRWRVLLLVILTFLKLDRFQDILCKASRRFCWFKKEVDRGGLDLFYFTLVFDTGLFPKSKWVHLKCIKVLEIQHYTCLQNPLWRSEGLRISSWYPRLNSLHIIEKSTSSLRKLWSWLEILDTGRPCPV